MWVVILLLPFGKGFSTDKRVLGTLSHINFTTKDGLPSNEVYCVFQDSKGFIWVGTDRGVARFDGYEFVVFTAEDGLTDNVIFGIAEDKSGNIWFTTSNLTLCYYNGVGEIIEYRYNEKIKSCIIDSNRSLSSFFDQISIQKQTIYLSKFNLGFLEIPLNFDGVIVNHIFSREKNNALNEGSIQIVNQNGYSNVYVNDCNGYMFNDDVSFDEKLKANNLNEIALLRPYLIDDSLLVIGGNVLNSKNYKLVINFNNNIHVFKVGDLFLLNEITRDPKGKVYLLENLTEPIDSKPIIHDHIRLTPPIIDRDNGLWLGSLEKGVFYIPNVNMKIINDEINVSNILPIDSGILYGERNRTIKLNTKTHREDLIGNVHFDILDVSVSRTIKLGVGVNCEFLKPALAKFDNQSSRVIDDFTFYKRKLFFTTSSSIFSYDKDIGLRLIKDVEFNFSSFDFNNKNVFFIGRNNGIAKFNSVNEIKEMTSFEEHLFVSTQYKPKEMRYIPSIKTLAVVFAGRGFSLFQKNKSEKRITTEDGLLSNSINQLVLKNDSQLWVATNKGVNVIDFFSEDSVKVTTLLNSSKSLLSPNVKQIFFENDSLVYIGTDHGLNALHLSKKQKELKANIYIEKIQVNGKTAKNRSRFKFEENTVEISYISLQYNHFGNVNYRFKLEGLSDQWVHSKERKATFLNLNPGKYSFYLQAQNESGSWDDLDYHFSFEIEKPFWTSWWFIIAVAFGIMLFIGVVLYYYLDNLRKERSFLKQEKLMSDKLNEIQQKALNSQLNPHFVFNSLNSIQNFILTKRTELSSDYLSMFSKLMRYVFENSKALYVSLADEIKALELYLKLERVRHNDKFDFEFSVKEIDLNKVNIPSLLIQPTVENAIWHGLLSTDRKDKKLEIRIFMQNENLIIEVEDNGVGRNYKKGFEKVKVIKKQKSSGIELTQHRLKLLRESTGLETDFQIIDLFDDNNTACGTLVRIQIPKSLQQ
ncbi:MAG: histidine kinase [Flavobacteriales bacterium]